MIHHQLILHHKGSAYPLVHMLPGIYPVKGKSVICTERAGHIHSLQYLVARFPLVPVSADIQLAAELLVHKQDFICLGIT